MTPTKLLLLDGESDLSTGNQLREILCRHRGGSQGIIHQVCQNSTEHRTLLTQVLAEFDAAVVFLVFGIGIPVSAADLIGMVRSAKSSPFCVAVLNTPHPEEIVRLLGLGLDGFLVPPLSTASVLPLIWHVLNRGDVHSHGEVQTAFARAKGLIGRSPSFLASIKDLIRMARTDATLLIEGETGTGKEIIAHAVHYLSDRSEKPFVALNCAVLRGELIENELFGHERGAYTNATERALGAIRQAEGGTLLLDELATLILPAQGVLLRFLQEKRSLSVGRPSHLRLMFESLAPATQV